MDLIQRFGDEYSGYRVLEAREALAFVEALPILDAFYRGGRIDH